MTIAKNKVVSIHYTLTGDDGGVIDSSNGREPFAFIHGIGMIVVGLEEALEGKGQGEKFNVSIPADKGYGPRHDQMVQDIPKDQFPADHEIKVGDQFHAQGDHGSQIVTVTAVAADKVTIDANHPLAGKTLNFDVEVIEVRDATPDELSHGHVHGPGGHQH